MATVLRNTTDTVSYHDALSGTDRAEGLDRWIFVLTAAFYIVIVLAGFIPDSLMKIGMVKAGLRPPFPAALHVHAVVMGGFLLFLFAQTWWVANGRVDRHQRWGPFGGLLALAVIAAGVIVAWTMYHQVWDGLQAAPEAAKAPLQALNHLQDNILLLQIRVLLLFTLLIALGLSARLTEPGLHKRMMIMAPAMALPAAFDRISWIPSTMPTSPMSATLYPLVAIAPLFLWDVYRNRRIHRAYGITLAAYVPLAIMCEYAWDKPWWHETARRVMGV